jgi:hypothetical protein
MKRKRKRRAGREVKKRINVLMRGKEHRDRMEGKGIYDRVRSGSQA